MIHLDPTERIEKTVRKHWFILFAELFALGMLFLLPLLLAGFVFRIYADTLTVTLSSSQVLFGISLWALLLWMKAFSIWTDYYLDALVLTNKRILHIEQFGFFKRHLSTLRLEHVEDVTVEINGILATFINYGDLHIQTAAETKEFVMKGIPHPVRTKEQIIRLIAVTKDSQV